MKRALYNSGQKVLADHLTYDVNARLEFLESILHLFGPVPVVEGVIQPAASVFNGVLPIRFGTESSLQISYANPTWTVAKGIGLINRTDLGGTASDPYLDLFHLAADTSFTPVWTYTPGVGDSAYMVLTLAQNTVLQNDHYLTGALLDTEEESAYTISVVSLAQLASTDGILLAKITCTGASAYTVDSSATFRRFARVHPESAAYPRDLVISGGNLIPNGDLETWWPNPDHNSYQTPLFWTESEPNLTQDDRAFSGKRSAKDNNETAFFTSPMFPISPGSFRFTFAYLNDLGSSTTSIQFDFYDSAGTFLSSISQNFGYSDVGNWTVFSYDLTVPTGASQMTVERHGASDPDGYYDAFGLYGEGSITSHSSANPIDHPDGSVTEVKLDTGAVTETKIGAGAVTETKIGAGAVTESKLGTGSVTVDKIGAGAVTDAKISTDNYRTIQWLAQDAHVPADSLTTYPTGISRFLASPVTSWPYTYGIVETIRWGTGAALDGQASHQILHAIDGDALGNGKPAYIRYWNNSVPGWNSWHIVATPRACAFRMAINLADILTMGSGWSTILGDEVGGGVFVSTVMGCFVESASIPVLGRFTVPVSGLYHFECLVSDYPDSITGTGSWGWVWGVNGSPASLIYANTNTPTPAYAHQVVPGSLLARLNVGDIIDIRFTDLTHSIVNVFGAEVAYSGSGIPSFVFAGRHLR